MGGQTECGLGAVAVHHPLFYFVSSTNVEDSSGHGAVDDGPQLWLLDIAQANAVLRTFLQKRNGNQKTKASADDDRSVGRLKKLWNAAENARNVCSSGLRSLVANAQTCTRLPAYVNLSKEVTSDLSSKSMGGGGTTLLS